MSIENIQDDVFFSVTSAMSIAGEAMESMRSTTLLMICLDGEGGADAVMGGETDDAVFDKVAALLERLKQGREESPEVLHIREMPAE